MSPDGSETKFRKEMRKQPVTLITSNERGVHDVIGPMNCARQSGRRLPTPPPIATKAYLLMKRFDLMKFWNPKSLFHQTRYSLLLFFWKHDLQLFSSVPSVALKLHYAETSSLINLKL